MDFSLYPRMLLDAFFSPPATLLFRAFLASLYSINQFSLSTSRSSHLLFSTLSLSLFLQREDNASPVSKYTRTHPREQLPHIIGSVPLKSLVHRVSAQGSKVLEIISHRGETMRGRGREIRRNSWLKASNPFRILLMKNPFSPLVYRK